MAVLRVKEPFSCDVGGVFRVYRVGDVVPADDPVVTAGRRQFFESVETAASRALPRVEQATAAPNERRGLTTIRKKAESDG